MHKEELEGFGGRRHKPCPFYPCAGELEIIGSIQGD
jgi:hypothetical protein